MNKGVRGSNPVGPHLKPVGAGLRSAVVLCRLIGVLPATTGTLQTLRRERTWARETLVVGYAEMESTLGYDMFVGSVADKMGLAGNVHRPGTSVVAAEDRSDSSMVVAYSISAHTVLWCDPVLAEDLSGLAEGLRSKSLDEISTWTERAGWERVGVAQMQLLRSGGLIRPTVDPSVMIRSLNRDRSPDVALIDAFKSTLPDHDRDQAELDGIELDEHMLAVVDDRGIAAFASQQPFLYADRFADIATATRPDVRGRGLGRIAVAALCDEIETRNAFPLYRCDTENHGSVKLSASLGFVPVIKVFACKRP